MADDDGGEGTREEDQERLFLDAARQGDLSTVQRLTWRTQQARAQIPRQQQPAFEPRGGTAASVEPLSPYVHVNKTRDATGRTALHHAAKHGHFAVVRYLLQHTGAHVEPPRRLSAGSGNRLNNILSPPGEAAEQGHVQVASELLDYGASLWVKDSVTALHLASFHGHMELVQLLIQRESTLGHVAFSRAESVNPQPQHGATVSGQGESPIKSVILHTKASAGRLKDPPAGSQTGSQTAPDENPKPSARLKDPPTGSQTAPDENPKPSARLKDPPAGSQKDSVSATPELPLVTLAKAAGQQAKQSVHAVVSYSSSSLADDSPPAAVSVKQRVEALVNAKSLYDRTALQMAAEQGFGQVVALLLQHGASLHSMTYFGLTALDLASAGGHLECVELLTNATLSESPTNRSSPGPPMELVWHMPLFLAARDAPTHAVVQWLLQHTPPSPDSLALALIGATQRPGRSKRVAFLLDMGANPNHVVDGSFNAKPALVQAAGSVGDLDMVQCLVEWTVRGEGGDYRITNLDLIDPKTGHAALHEAALMGRLDICRYLVEQGANWNLVAPTNGRTPLHCAVISQKLPVLELFLNVGAQTASPEADLCSNVNQPNSEGMTPLHEALIMSPQGFGRERALVPTLSLLLSRGADVNQPDSQGLTPLHKATWNSANEVAMLFLHHGANVTMVDGTGKTVLHLASYQRNQFLVRQFTERVGDATASCADFVNAMDDTGMTALHLAVKSGSLELVSDLMARGANVHAETLLKCTPLFLACHARHTNIVPYLVEAHGADVNTKNSDGWSALHQACSKDRFWVMEFLLDKGADPNAADLKGWSVLHQASFGDSRDAAQMLLDYGANVNTVDHLGWTPLHEATLRQQPFMMDLLLQNGADMHLETTSSTKTSAMTLAAQNGHVDLVRQLVTWEYTGAGLEW